MSVNSKQGSTSNPRKPDMLSLKKSTSRFTLEINVIRMGADLCVTLSGGDISHIGAVALAIPHPGLRDTKLTDASVSLLTVTGHKEDELARNIAQRLSKEFACTVSVSCGIHLENASKQDISSILDTSKQLLEEMITALKFSS